MSIKSWLKIKLHSIRLKIKPTLREREVVRFNNDNGEELKFKYLEINQNSVILDLGGFKGDFASNLFARMPCKIHIFEPVPKFALNIKNRFKKNQNIICNEFGLYSKNEEKLINVLEDNTSSYKNKKLKNSNTANIKLVDILEYLEDKKIDIIDLMKINIEGAEYEILPYLIKTKKINSIKQILIQFHDIERDSIEKRNNIRENLKKTHVCKFCYEFAWELWIKI